MKDIAQENGDLTVRISTKSQDEIGELVHWFNSFIEKLQGVIKNVVETAKPIESTAHNIQSLSNQRLPLSKRKVMKSFTLANQSRK